MLCLFFHLFPLLLGWWKHCCLSFDYLGEWRGLVKLDLCALMSRGWSFCEQWNSVLGSNWVRWALKVVKTANRFCW